MTGVGDQSFRWRGVLYTAGGCLVAALVVLAFPDLRNALGDALSGDTDALRDALAGLEGAVLIVLLILLHAVVFFPSEVVNGAAGYAYGALGGLLLVYPAWIASGVIAYFVGKAAGRPIVMKLLGAGRVGHAEEVIERGGWQALLAARLIPIMPYSFVGYVAGAANVPLWRYTWTSTLGALPITAIVVILGSRLEEISPTDPILLGGLAVVTLLLIAGPLVWRWRYGR